MDATFHEFIPCLMLTCQCSNMYITLFIVIVSPLPLSSHFPLDSLPNHLTHSNVYIYIYIYIIYTYIHIYIYTYRLPAVTVSTLPPLFLPPPLDPLPIPLTHTCTLYIRHVKIYRFLCRHVRAQELYIATHRDN